MDQERWGTINRIFHAALEVNFSQRRALVAAQSNGDPDLQAEVEHLLEADAKAGFRYFLGKTTILADGRMFQVRTSLCVCLKQMFDLRLKCSHSRWIVWLHTRRWLKSTSRPRGYFG